MQERAKQAIEALRAAEPRLRTLGIVRAAVFGSQVRGEAGPDSDVDILIELDGRRMSVFDLVGIEREVSELIAGPVDVVAAEHLKPQLRSIVLSEAEYAF